MSNRRKWMVVALLSLGFVTDWLGVRWPYAISFLLWGVVSASTAFASSLRQLIIIRLLLGIGEAIITPASLKWITANISERQRGLAVGILFAGSKFGPALGAAIGARLIARFSWRVMFLVIGLGPLVFLLPWLAWLRDEQSPRPQAAGGRNDQGFAAIWKTPAIYGILMGTVAYNYFNYFNLTWLPAYFVERWDMSLTQMGYYTAFAFIGMAAVAIAGGTMADGLVRRGGDPITVRKLFTVAGLVIAATEIFGTMTASRDVAVASALISMAGLGLTTANYWVSTQTLMPGAAIGRISGVQNFASNLAGVVSPALTGWLLQSTGSYDASMQAILVVLGLGVAAYLLLVRRRFAPAG